MINNTLKRGNVMKLSILIIVTLASLLSIGCEGGSEQGSRADSAVVVASDVYTCPMHPSVISDRPGACPVCGMALVKKAATQTLPEEALGNLEKVSLSPTQRVLANISTMPALQGALTKDITLVGIVEAAESRTATVSARFRGRIERLFVNYTGEVVSRGQPLFELYSPDLVTSQQEFILALDGQPQMVSGIRDRLRLHYGMTDEQIASVESTRTVRTTLTFHSPIQGTVIQKQVQPGQYVDEGMALYQLADLSTVWILLDVYEKDLSGIRIGQRVYISTESLPQDRFSGKVTFIDAVMNPVTRTARIRTEFSNRLGRLKPQMYVTATISLPSVDGIVIPASAVLSTGKREVVWVEVRPGAFEPREVIAGVRSGGDVQILKGLEPGELVAVTGGFLLDSESALTMSASSPHSGHAPAIPHRDDHTGHEAPTVTEQRKYPDSATIVVDGTYSPDVIRVRPGRPVTLNFQRNEDAKCTEEVVFEELNIRRQLPAFRTTAITITPSKPGTIHFACGMGMVHGTLIVDPWPAHEERP